jgi:hypothetical protein
MLNPNSEEFKPLSFDEFRRLNNSPAGTPKRAFQAVSFEPNNIDEDPLDMTDYQSKVDAMMSAKLKSSTMIFNELEPVDDERASELNFPADACPYRATQLSNIMKDNISGDNYYSNMINSEWEKTAHKLNPSHVKYVRINESCMKSDNSHWSADVQSKEHVSSGNKKAIKERAELVDKITDLLLSEKNITKKVSLSLVLSGDNEKYTFEYYPQKQFDY